MTRKHLLSTKMGISIIELMLIIAIGGLIFMIAFPNYVKSRRTTLKSLCKSNQKMLFSAAMMYELKEEESLEGLSDLERLEALTEGGYLRGVKWRECPTGGYDDYNDYVLIFEDGVLSDVECKEDPAGHKWP